MGSARKRGRQTWKKFKFSIGVVPYEEQKRLDHEIQIHFPNSFKDKMSEKVHNKSVCMAIAKEPRLGMSIHSQTASWHEPGQYFWPVF